MTTRPSAAWALGLAAGAAVLLIVLWTLGALTETTDPGLPVTPWSTLLAFPLDRFARDVAACLVLGFAIVGGVLVPRPDGRLLRVVSLLALVWLAALIAQVVLTISELLGRSWADSVDPIVVQSLLAQTLLGQLLIVQMALVALVAILGWAVINRFTAWIVVSLSAVAALLPALSGHSGLHSGHTAASVSLAIHLVSLGVWVGGLVAVCVYVGRQGADAALVVRRFSTLALVCVILLAESGLLNASLRVDGVASLVTSTYGSLVLAKATLLLALVVLGWRQRSRVVPRMDAPAGRFDLLRLAGYEFLLLGIALGLSAALARTAPPAGAITGDQLTLGAFAVLGVCAPLVLVWGLRVPGRIAGVTRDYPEAFAVGLLIACAVVALIVPSPRLGIGGSAIVGSLLLLACGYLFAVGACGARGVPAVVIVMVGWPALAWWQLRQQGPDSPGSAFACVVIVETCLLLLILLGRSRRATPPESVVPPLVEVGT